MLDDALAGEGAEDARATRAAHVARRGGVEGVGAGEAARGGEGYLFEVGVVGPGGLRLLGVGGVFVGVEGGVAAAAAAAAGVVGGRRGGGVKSWCWRRCGRAGGRRGGARFGALGGEKRWETHFSLFFFGSLGVYRCLICWCGDTPGRVSRESLRSLSCEESES